MEQLCKQEAVNMTAALEALSPWLKNPRRTVVQVEASTAVVIVLLLLQLIFASCRGRSSGYFVQGGTWLTYTLPFPLIAYTLGLMQSSPVKNAMYPIWAASLVLAAGCTNAVKAYELDDNKQWMRSLFDFLQYYVFFIFICNLLNPRSISIVENLLHFRISALKTIQSISIELAVLFVVTFCQSKAIHCLLVDRGNLDRRVAEFMKRQVATTNDDGFDPVSMKGYKYPVRFSLASEVRSSVLLVYKIDMNALAIKIVESMCSPVPVSIDNISPSFSFRYVITIDQIWQCEGWLLSSGTHCQELKDVCLAYSLYQLLKRRYYGMACAEQNRPETRDFVLKGLLENEDDCAIERAFRIVEAELGFCHDYFFTKHTAIFRMEVAFFCLFLVRIILLILIAVDVLKNSFSVKTTSPVIEVHNEKAERIITLFIMFTILAIELLQVAFYMVSDWFKVSVACYYFRSSRFQGNPCIEKLFPCLIRLTTFFRTRYWKNMVDQYPIVSDNSTDIVSLLDKVKRAMFGSRDDARMLKMVKMVVARYLVLCQGELSNGEESLRRNNVHCEEFDRALKGQSQVEIMLIWSTATEYCNIAPNNRDSVNVAATTEQETVCHRKVSVCLSRYCAYLMHSVPELLPGNYGDTKIALTVLKDKVSKVQPSQGAPVGINPKYQALMDLPEQEDNSILMRGLKLGKKLESMPDRWKLMADFWAEKILYVAPSENVKGHMEHLAKGGEFLTHVWALLTHAGIVKINRVEHDEGTTPSQPSQANV